MNNVKQFQSVHKIKNALAKKPLVNLGYIYKMQNSGYSFNNIHLFKINWTGRYESVLMFLPQDITFSK